jgi:hypothetical protein
MIKAAAERGVRLLLPVDVLVSQSLDKAEVGANQVAVTCAPTCRTEICVAH